MLNKLRAYPLLIILIGITLLSTIGFFSYNIFFSRAEIAEVTAACTKDVMTCPDGTMVGRSGPSCDFICPDPSNIKIGCTRDLKLCPDGKGVGRSGPNCEFPSCPRPPLNKPVLTLTPRSTTIADNSSRTIDLTIISPLPNITAADVELSYDNSQIVIDKIEPTSNMPSIISSPKFDGGKAKFAFGVSPAAYQEIAARPTEQIISTEEQAQDPRDYPTNGGICPQVTGNCIGKDGVSCAHYSNYCERPQVCELPIRNCVLSSYRKGQYQIARITFHAANNPTKTLSQSSITTTPNTTITAISSQENIETTPALAEILLQTTHFPGDLNQSGIVDLFDFNLLVSKFGNPYTLFDFNDIVANFGKNS